jgi:hypothetical protein
MNDIEIRAKALEIALLFVKPDEASISFDKQSPRRNITMSKKLYDTTEAVIQFIKNGNIGETNGVLPIRGS